MRLKKIKLAGFKSFVDPTTIPFPDDMTAVVGPNGCGKSNVIDAVRWVLGESSAKNLRGDAMTDVIFNGSTARKPVSQCSVELVFDNTSGRIQGEYAGYNELSVKRIVTKEAQSSYLLNNIKCRRRDVTDLFLGTGLGPRSYAIIEQGMISRLIESKPQELRVFIEEAAGVSKYKERRRETETRIRHTKENLERLEDVRGELGQQLEKLQRQATAAKKFKDLKQHERTYKSELAALRWLKHNQQVEKRETEISQKNADIEAYVATQRSEEKEISLYKQQQQDTKQQLTDIQQNLFKVGADISRIEQNQIHAKQRRQQVEQESNALKQTIEDNQQHYQLSNEKIAELAAQLATIDPEKSLLEEQFEQAQSVLIGAEEQLQQLAHQWRNQDQDFNQRKQQAQVVHGKIQALMSMQLRTEQRLSELKDELNEVLDDELSQKIKNLQGQLSSLELEKQQQNDMLEQAQQQQHNIELTLTESQQDNAQTHGQLQSVEAQLDALNTLQKSQQEDDRFADLLSQHKIDQQSWWQTLQIESGWEDAFEVITEQWQQALVLANNNQQIEFATIAGGKWLYTDQFTQEFPQYSIGHKLKNQAVPAWLSNIMYADNIQQGIELLTQLEDYQSVVTRDGCWFGQGWMVVGGHDQQSGLLKRASQIKILEQQQQDLQKQHSSCQQRVADLQQQLVQAKRYSQSCQQNCADVQQHWQQTGHQLTLLTQQQQQNVQRNSRLSADLARQHETSEQEKQTLEELSLQAEELEHAVERLQEHQQESEQQREQQQQQVVNARGQVEASKNSLHQLALQQQAIQSQHQGLTANVAREEQLLTNMRDKLALLQQELTELLAPLEDQQISLQQLLEQKNALDIEQQQLTESLQIIEEKLFLAEKGQQGVTDKIQHMLAELQTIKLECEGSRVRANAVLEQFQEMQQTLDSVLNTLPDDATEDVWQNKLDKTTASVARLGAVNLAAVEEYDLQAMRKKHLDDQNDDLVAALDILEQAIRKIDKETRSRFKETFDQVNDDLKLLFPKVFGGGLAYLELTDEDLLETGVTIMARPPGKKNSTIHLLSGGEKALTALSLVFAIFRLNPAPFCLLDEVDAPLDDANVGRFCKLVSEMSKSVQFIYITHNKIAMEMATHLTGVTMAEPGVSRMVAVDVDEAVAIAQA